MDGWELLAVVEERSAGVVDVEGCVVGCGSGGDGDNEDGDSVNAEDDGRATVRGILAVLSAGPSGWECDMAEAALYASGLVVVVGCAVVAVVASVEPGDGSGPCMAENGGVMVSYRTGKQQPKRCLETRLSVMGWREAMSSRAAGEFRSASGSAAVESVNNHHRGRTGRGKDEESVCEREEKRLDVDCQGAGEVDVIGV